MVSRLLTRSFIMSPFPSSVDTLSASRFLLVTHWTSLDWSKELWRYTGVEIRVNSLHSLLTMRNASTCICKKGCGLEQGEGEDSAAVHGK
ncbi:hypothetical protein R1flu_007610 [Riccia fluitans]|uniref:Uncharacterized protein n=1 Tax=Riccia fluitans TaxID=41844 RepID=A0ABD1YZE9_9MARC